MSEESRKRPAHHPPVEYHNRSIILFVTICAYHRHRVLANKEVHEALLQAWNEADHWHVGRYVIMPDHIHLFCSPARHDAATVGRWVSYWKRLVSQQCAEVKPLWQRDYWDTQLRANDSYHEKWAYVCNNPVRDGLISCADEWPFQGVVHHLVW